ncbi:MAG: VOC family protein [Bacteroidota bacterium]
MAQTTQVTLDHILIRVDDLASAVAEFESMGFKVYYGNAKKNCHHAMIYFQNGTFLELVDPNKFPGLFRFLAKKGWLDALGIQFKRFAHYAKSQDRFLDFAVLSQDIQAFYQASEELKRSKLMDMKRKNHVGARVEWKLFAFEPMELPFIMSAYTPHRLPEPQADKHENGVLGIQQMAISVHDLPGYLSAWETHFGLVPTADQHLSLGPVKLTWSDQGKYRMKGITMHGSTVATVNEDILANYGIHFTEKIPG